MTTVFRLKFEGKPDLELNKFRRSLPPDWRIEEKDDGVCILINSALTEDERCQYLIDRELDRHFFLTSVRIQAEIVRKTVVSDLTVRFKIHGRLPDDIQPQIWNYDLAIQLRLWAVAADVLDVRVKLLLLFQIIEIAHQDKKFPEYKNSSIVPHPLTECKFIRDLVAHSGIVAAKQLKLYCEYLGLPEVMHDMTDPYYNAVIASKLPIMESQAKIVIEQAL